jgi:hypothetical protein
MHMVSIAKASTMNYIFAICVLLLVPIVQPKISLPIHSWCWIYFIRKWYKWWTTKSVELGALQIWKLSLQTCPTWNYGLYRVSCSSKSVNFLFSSILVFDASSKVNPGIFSLNLRWYGNYDQCLDTSEVIGGRVIEGQYCNAFYNSNS